MNSNRINVTLGFNADVGAAKANLKDLQATLNEISNLKLEPGTNLNKSLQEAISSADILQQHLNAAMDVKTGNINVDKFTASISKSSQSILQLGNNLLKAGMTGEKAFTQLQNGLTMANIKLTKSKNLLDEFSKTLANTVRWQISSTILHGFMGTIQRAYGYAQDLNKSLTNIQIVTQQTTEQMEAFAERANKAAKALSASTLAYTDAALIYYQQGLDDSTVEARTDVTIKMMNVTDKSAEEISSQMTAIWNNFDDGTKSLEYYADAIAALGAATASSSKEIAEGLQKFAAVADTVGLSYEYATAALATVVAETRQSADIVGTAFKTLFSRLEGLKLGETLEDGVDLNKYSKALQVVGVNILDANNNLKAMDTILDDLGARWDTLTTAQQVSLAQTVGGVRQYQQFVALMDNWDKVQKNILVAANSEGTLQEQADVYAKSWEAAKKRVKASFEELYTTLIDDKFFIGLTDTLSKVISLVTTLAKGMGGVSGILMFVANILMTKFAPQITMALNSGIEKISHFSLNLKSLVNPITTIKDTFILMGRDSEQAGAIMARRTQELGKALEASAISGQQLAKELNHIGTTSTQPLTEGFKAQQAGLEKINGLIDVYQGNYSKLTEQERQLIQGQLTELVNLNNNVAAAHDMVEELESQRDILRDIASFDVVDQENYDINSEGTAATLNVSGVSDELRIISSLIEDTGANVTYVNGQAQQIQGTTTELGSVMANVSDELEDSVAVSHDLGKVLEHVTLEVDKTGKLTTKGDRALRQIYGSLGKTSKSADILVKRLQRGSISVEQFQRHLKNLPSTTARFAKQMGLSDQKILSALKNGRELNNAQKKLTQETNNYNSALTKAMSTLSTGITKAMSIGGQIQGVVQGLNGLAMGVNAVRNAFSTLNDENASFWDKFSAFTMGGVMALSGFMSAMQAMNNILNASIGLSAKRAAAGAIENTVDATKLGIQKALSTEEGKNAVLAAKQLILSKAKAGASEAETTAEVAALLTKQTKLSTEEAELAATSLLTSAKEANIVATTGQAGAEVLQTSATVDATAAQWSLNAAIYANPVGAIVLAIMAFIAALAALIAIIAVFRKQEDEAVKKEKAAAAALEESKEAAKKAHEAYDELYTTVSNYKSAVDALKKCTKGTREWQEAFEEVNKQARDLLKKYPDLLKYKDIFNSDGSINIERLSKYVEEIGKTAQSADVLTLHRQSDLAVATNDRKVSDLRTKYQTSVNRQNRNVYKSSIAEAIIDKVRFEDINVNNIYALEKAIGEVVSSFGLTGDEFNSTVEEMVFSISLLETDFVDLASETKNTIQSLINTQKLIAQELFPEDAAENPALASAEVEAYNEMRQKIRDSYQDAIDYANDHNAFLGDNVENMRNNDKGGKKLIEIAEDYIATDADMKTGNWEVVSKDAIKKKDGVTYIQYRNNQGDTTLRKVESVIDAVAEQKAVGKLDEIKDQGREKYDKRQEQMGAAGQEFLVNENFSEATIGNVKSLQGRSFEKIYGDDDKLRNTLAAKYGLDANEITSGMISSFKQKYYNSIQGVQDAIGKLPTAMTTVLGDGVDQLSVTALNGINTLHSNLVNKADEVTAASVESSLTQLAVDNPKHMQEIISTASQIDWIDPKALERFNDLLASQGIILDQTSASYTDFIASLKDIPLSINPANYQEVRKSFQSLKEMAEDIKIGSIISDEDYQKIIETDSALQALFVQTANGYVYTGSQDLGKIVKEKFQDNIRQSLDQATTALAGIDASDNYGYGDFKSIDYGAVASQISDGDGPDWATSFLGTLANSEDAEELAAIAGVSVKKFKELASKNMADLTEEESATVESIYQSIAEHQGDLVAYQQNITDGLIQLGSSYDSYAEGLAAIRSYANEEYISDEQIQTAIVGMTNAAVMGVQSLDELDTILNEIAQAEQNVDYNTIAAALMNLASQYENCTAEVEKYQTAMRSGNTEALKVAEDQLRASILLGEAAEKYGLNANVLESQARSIQALNNDMELNAETAAQMAIANQRMNKGIDTLSDNFEDWTKKLKTATRGSMDYAEVAAEVEGALKDLLGLSDNFELPEGFLDSKENLKLLEEAANGSQLAINKLGIQMVKGAMDITSWDQALIDAYNATAATDKTMSEFTMDMQTAFDTANAGMQAIQDNIVALTNGSMTLSQALDGVDLNEEDWIKSLNEMAVATGMSVEEMRSMLNSMGVRANVEVDYVEQRTKVPTYTEVVEPGEEVTYYDSEGQPQTRRGWKHYTVPGDPIEVEGSVPVPHISINDDDLAAHTISEKTISFSGVGGGKTGGGISHSKTTNGKKSGSSSSKEKKDKKSAEKETERYHEITALIEDYTRELDKAGKAKDRAFGPKKLKAMQAEIAAQAQLNAATEEHIREIREWLEIDKARIAAQGATFDEYGNISNYTDLMQQHIDAYNAAVAAYNASGQSDSDKEAMEAADKAYQDFMDQLSQYEETNNLLQEKLDELIEAQQAKYDKEFEMLQYTIEFKIEADDSILSYLDYMKNKIENFNDGVHDAVEMLATLNDEASTLMNKSSIYNRAIDDTLSHYLSNKGMEESDIQALIDRFKSNNMSESDMSMLEDMTEAEYQYLLELKDNLLEINNSLIENMSAVLETIRNSFSKIAEDLDKATRPIERAASALENYVAIIDIIGRDALGVTDAIATELDNAAIAVAHSATISAKAKVDTLQNERDEVQRLYDEAMAQGLTEMAYKWKIVLEEMDEEIAAATDDFNSKWQEELTKAREAFENTVERIKQSMLDAFAGFIGSWSVLKDSLEYAKTATDRFVPQYKEIYELSKLNRDIMKSIDNTSNIKNKQALRDLQKEINELEQHSGEISQYDLDNARRRYELELARLQLEEARDAKSTVRLSKDSEGNWSYVYTANQDDVEKAEQNYEDKLYAMQQANSEYINSLSDQILALEEQYAEKLAEIRLDNTMSEEERNAAIERLNAYFAEQMEYLTNEGQKAVDNNARLFEEEWTAYHNWTDAFGNDVQTRIDNQHDFMTQFGDTILGTYTGYGNFDELNTAMVQIAEEASVKMEEAYGALQAQVATAMEAAGIDVAHFGEVVHDTVNDQIVPSAQAAEDAVVEMGKAAVDEFKELTDGISTWQTKYTTEMQKIIQKNEQLAASVNNLAAVYANLIAQMYAVANAPVPKFSNSAADYYANTGAGGQSASGGDPNSNGPEGNEKYSDSEHWRSDHHYHWRVRTYKSGRTEKIDKGRHKWYLCDPIVIDSHHHSPTTFESAYCAVCGKKISINPWHQYASVEGQEVIIPGYDTGGYTGNWNSSQGKLAMLHEKELVLNKEDTKNILGTVELVRKLSQKIDLNAQTARYAFNYHPIINNPKLTDRELQVNQTVSITAEFPNAQNRTEIEEAFTTLINQASQFANQKN